MFSVIIPYFNKEAYIFRCINSVLHQTFTEYEIIIVDDGSTDNGIELISNLDKKNISIVSQKNQGVSAARNYGIKQAKYKYVAFLDADDAWHSQYLEKVNWIISNEIDVKIIGSHYSRKIDFFDKRYESTEYFKFNNYFKEAIRNTYFTSSSSVIQKKFFEENHGFNTHLKKGEDLDVWFRVILSGGNSFYITNTLVFYSDEDTNQVTKNKIPLENDLVGNSNELYKNLKSRTDPNFNRFISLYVYFNLYSYFFDKENNEKAQLVLKENKYRFFWLHLVYFIPFFIGEKLVKLTLCNRFIRLYMKFIIRHIIQ